MRLNGSQILMRLGLASDGGHHGVWELVRTAPKGMKKLSMSLDAQIVFCPLLLT